MAETWFEKQERQRREYIARRLDYLEAALKQMQQRIKRTNLETKDKNAVDP